MPEIYLAYSHRDRQTAESLPPHFQALAPAHLVVEHNASSDALVDRVPPTADLLFLLVSNNFLLDADAVFKLSELLAKVPHVAVIDAGHATVMPDWQQRYLQLRADALHYGGEALENFRLHLDRVRQISLALPAALAELEHQPKVLLHDLLAGPDGLQRILDQSDISPSKITPERPRPLRYSPEETIQHAWTLCDAGDIQEGLSVLSNAVTVTPESADLSFQYALMLALEAEDFSLARARLDNLLDHHPNHHDALFLSGELYEGTGQVAGARVQWDRLSDLCPEYPKLDERLGNLIYRYFPDNAREAAAHYKKAVKLPDTEAATHVGYARLLNASQGKKRKARKQLRRAIEKDPASAEAHYELAVLEYASGKLVGARKNYLLATTLEPTYDTPTNRLAFYGGDEAVASPAPNDDRTNNLLTRIEELEQALTESRQQQNTISKTSPVMTVLISGATSGIGRATARVLAQSGHRLILLGRREERLLEITEELSSLYRTKVHTVQLDVRDRPGVFEAIQSLPEEWQTIDVLLNNAGKAKGFDPIQSGDVDHWEEMIDVNLKGLLYLTRAVTPGMVERGRGTVVNVASTAGKEVYPKGNVYCATKHAVDALTYAMRLDLVSHGIRVGQICPAHVEETEFAVVRFDGDTERAKIYQDFQPLRSADVAEAIRFMIEQPAHVNVMDMVLQGTQQASSTVIDRSGRDKFAPNQE